MTPTGIAHAVAAAVPDPEVPVLTIGDLGVLRDVTVDAAGHAHDPLERASRHGVR